VVRFVEIAEVFFPLGSEDALAAHAGKSQVKTT
jgi:hypothetical protein